MDSYLHNHHVPHGLMVPMLNTLLAFLLRVSVLVSVFVRLECCVVPSDRSTSSQNESCTIWLGQCVPFVGKYGNTAVFLLSRTPFYLYSYR